jgi:large subunit ribosomal protein L13
MDKKKSDKNLKTYEIDATGKAMGRLASEVAIIITGKKQSNYLPNTIPLVKVIISNIDKVKISDKKLKDNIFYQHSGYPGGLKEKQWSDIFNKNPQLLFMKIINNMIPSNKLKKHLLKKIIFE